MILSWFKDKGTEAKDEIKGLGIRQVIRGVVLGGLSWAVLDPTAVPIITGALTSAGVSPAVIAIVTGVIATLKDEKQSKPKA